MELITRLYDEPTLNWIQGLLRSKGIPTYVRRTGAVGWGSKSDFQAALFVCINKQAEDARRVIQNPEFDPANPVDAEKFENSLKSTDYRVISKWATIIFIIVVLTIPGLIYLLSR